MTDQRRRERPEALCPSFATVDRLLGISEVRCRCCGLPIKKLLPVGPQKTRRVRNQTFIETHVALCPTAAYREVELFMEDGSRHVGNVCADCAPKLADMTYAARFCETDLKQWRSEGVQITEKMDRRPVRLGRVADHVE